MQVKIFSVPAFGSAGVEEELNKFLRSHRILQVERHFCAENGGYWAVFVEYVLGDPIAEVPLAYRKEKKDFTADMTDEEKQRFEQFKEIRKRVAIEKSMPAYLVFTNEELSILARLTDLSNLSTSQTKGIAPSRLKDNLIYFQITQTNETRGQSNAINSEFGELA